MAVSFTGGGNHILEYLEKTTASYWKTLSHNVVSSTHRLRGIQTHVIGDGH